MYVRHTIADSGEDIDRIRLFLEGIPKVHNFPEQCYWLWMYIYACTILNFFSIFLGCARTSCFQMPGIYKSTDVLGNLLGYKQQSSSPWRELGILAGEHMYNLVLGTDACTYLHMSKYEFAATCGNVFPCMHLCAVLPLSLWAEGVCCTWWARWSGRSGCSPKLRTSPARGNSGVWEHRSVFSIIIFLRT